MLRGVAAFLIASGLAAAGLLPEQAGRFRKISAVPIEVAERAIWDEYGLVAAEKGAYESAEQRGEVSVWRFKDPTGAMAAFQWQQRPGLVRNGNYLIEIGAYKALFDAILPLLPQRSGASVPTLPGYLPEKGRIKGSERFVAGPVSLAAFGAPVTASLAAFHFSTEAQIARYRVPGGEAALAVFSYPTPAIARERVNEFQKVPGVQATRSGPLVVAALNSPSKEAGERLISRVAYRATITESEKVPKQEGNAGDMLIGIFILAGVLAGTSVLLGFVFGGMRPLLRRFGIQTADNSFTSLDLRG